jgi:hypothetical protein
MIVPMGLNLESQGGPHPHGPPIRANVDAMARNTVYEFSSERMPLNRTGMLLPGQRVSLCCAGGFPLVKIDVNHGSYMDLRNTRPPIALRLYVDDCRMNEKTIPFEEWCDY